MVLMAMRRSSSVLPTAVCSTPTPKSKPSSTKKPVQKTATTPNQNTSIFDSSLVRQRWHLFGLEALLRGGLATVRRALLVGEVAAGVAEHQEPVDRGQHAVDGDEEDQRDPDLRRA